MKKLMTAMLTGLTTVVLSSVALAYSLTPVTTPTLGAPDYTSSAAIKFATTGVLGTATQNVYLNNTLGGLTGVMFTYDIARNTNEPSKAVKTMTAFYFDEITSLSQVSVGYFSDSTGTIVPTAWDMFGDTLELDFPTLPAGTSLKTLYVQTDLPTVKGGYYSLIGSGTQDIPGYVPTAVPEPATMSLLGMGLMGLMGLRRKQTV